MYVVCECRVLSRRGLCDELITHPEESYRMRVCVCVCVCVCPVSVIRCNNNCLHLRRVSKEGQTKKERK